jgi:hypothetical protein
LQRIGAWQDRIDDDEGAVAHVLVRELGGLYVIAWLIPDGRIFPPKSTCATAPNFVLPHASLRQTLTEPVPTNGTGSAKRWRPRTPAMAAGLTDHPWTLREVLRFRVPPWPQLQAQAL